MTIELLTVMIFAASFVCGGIAFHRSARYDENDRTLVHFAARVSFGITFFLAVWACAAYAMWLMGTPLKIGTVADGRMAEFWWLGPSCLILAGLMRVVLRYKAPVAGE